MTRVLAVCSPADPTGSVKQFDLALPTLREAFEVRRHAQLADVRELVGEWKPDLIHTLGGDAFRAVRKVAAASVVARRNFPKWLAAGAAAVEPAFGLAPGLTAVVTQSGHESDWAARLTPAPMQFSVPVAVANPSGGREPPVSAHFGGLTLPARYVLAAGGFDAVANLKHVVWAFDVLKYTHRQLQLVLLGDGPQRADIEHFARTLGREDYRVQFAGFQSDITPFLGAAVQAWGCHTRGGTKFLLEAMASGVPVIAARTADVERVVTDGVSGSLVPAGRPVEMARVAHALLTSPDRAAALVVAGQAVACRHAVADLAHALAGVYDTLTSSVSPRSG